MIKSISKEMEFNVLGNSFVKYVSHHGSDLDIVNIARNSYRGKSKGPEKDKGLMKYLIKNKHTSPFELCSVTFNIRMPIFVMRQFVRHRTFRLNEISARYTELDLGFYMPEKWREQDTKNKQGSISGEDLCHEGLTEDVQYIVDECNAIYFKMLEHGVAREMARIVLPLNTLTEIIVNCDLNNLLKYFALRDDNHAQWEHQEIARAMQAITFNHFPWVMEIYQEIREGK